MQKDLCFLSMLAAELKHIVGPRVRAVHIVMKRRFKYVDYDYANAEHDMTLKPGNF